MATTTTAAPPRHHYTARSSFRKFTPAEYRKMIETGGLVGGEPNELSSKAT